MPPANEFYASLARARRDEARLQKHRGKPLGTTSYLLCITPRSGSSWLCDLLARKGLGMPNEYMNPELLAPFLRRTGAGDAVEYFDALRRVFRTPQGLFGAKVAWHHLEMVLAGMPIEAVLGTDVRYVYLTRRSLIQQAISLYLAAQTGYFHSVQPKLDPEVKRRYASAPYDAGRIRDWADALLAHEHGFEGFFERRGIQPLRLKYEHAVERPRATVALIASHLGGGLAPGRLDTAYEKIGTERNLEWARRFRSEHAAYVEFWKKHRGRVHPGEARIP